MKFTQKTTGIAEITDKDLLPIIKDWMRDQHGYTVTKLERGKDKMVVHFVSESDGGVKAFGKPTKDKIERASNEGFQRRWVGVYEAIGEILDSKRKHKKNFISWEDLYEELLAVEDGSGRPKFEKDGKRIEMERVKQYCSPSQIERQAMRKLKDGTIAGQKNLRGVKPDKKLGGLLF